MFPITGQPVSPPTKQLPPLNWIAFAQAAVFTAFVLGFGALAMMGH